MTTLVRSKWIRSLSICLMGATGLSLMSGLGCGAGGGLGDTGGGGGGSSDTPTGAILQPTSNVNIENGQSTNIQYFAQSPSSAAKLDVYLDRDSTRGNGNEVELVNGIDVPAGTGGISGSLTFNSTNVPNATYSVFGQIRYGSGLSQTLTFVSVGAIVVTPVGSQPRPQAPTIVVDNPSSNLGLTAQDIVQIVYRYTSPGAASTVTLLLDKDRIPTNDDINNPGDPNDPNSKIIILPSKPRDANDPTFGNDPPPPDNPNNPPTNVDSVEVRKNPRQLPQTANGAAPVQKVYIFSVDFSRIPPRADGSPYYIRATISDGINPAVHSYASGALTITSLAAGVVDAGNIGRTISGARFQGFQNGEYLGTNFLRLGDFDGDSVDDFVLVSRYGAPRNRFESGFPVLPAPNPYGFGTGAAYLFFGRKKLPFPPDTNGNGTPDFRDENGNVVDFPTPPTFIFRDGIGAVSPYDSRSVGRFGGVLSVGSVGAAVGGQFYRGVTFGMPRPHDSSGFFWPNRRPNPVLGEDDELVPVPQREANHPGMFTAGLTSITSAILSSDGVPDFVFGLPYIANPRDWVDDDPCDSAPVGSPPLPADYLDGFPNHLSDSPPTLDMLTFDHPFHDIDLTTGLGVPGPINTGLVIASRGSNDIAGTFRQFVDAAVAGQFTEPGGGRRAVSDEEGFLIQGQVPDGMRFRGAYETGNFFDADVNFPSISPFTEYGADVAAVPSLGNDLQNELIVSAPGFFGQTGFITIIQGGALIDSGGYVDTVQSWPTPLCVANPAVRRFLSPTQVGIVGAVIGDRFGRPAAAGDVNGDSRQDILCGSVAASRDNLTNNGIFYILFNPPGNGFGNSQLPRLDLTGPPSNSLPFPRLEIHGSHNNDRFGDVHARLGDINGDGLDDIAFASPFYDRDGLVDRGYVGVVFGSLNLTGELGFRPEDVGTANLHGLRILGTHAGDKAGISVAGAGDFNGDGFADLLVAAGGEQRVGPDGRTRLGVAYIILGGTHLNSLQEIDLSQVGSAAVPGVVILSPYEAGDVLEAPNPPTFEKVAGVGDVDGDGFDDIMIGAPRADYINPAPPFQRRPDAGEAFLVYGSPLQ